MFNGTGVHPWNYTLPDLEHFMNSTGLPPVHDLLGLTTTTTEVVSVNKPIFPLNLTLWSAITSSWRGNYTKPGSPVIDSYAEDMEDSFTTDRGPVGESLPDLNYNPYEGSHGSNDNLGGGYHLDESRGSPVGFAQMVVPASVGSIFQQSAPHHHAPFNISFMNHESIGLLVFDNSTTGTTYGNLTTLTTGGEGVRDPMSTLGVVVMSVLLGLMILTTVIGNVFVIAAILMERNLHQVANALIVSLAVADLFVACFVMPFGAVYEIERQWTLGPALCDVWTTCDVLCCTASILHLVAIALDRYWAVTHVDYIQTRRNAKRIGIMIFLVWMTAVVVSGAPFFGWKDPDYLLRVSQQKKCLVSQDLSYQIFATLATFYVPLTAILLLYWKIFQTARKRLHKRPGRSEAPRKISFRSKSKDKKKDAKSTRSNGLIQQQATTTFTESPQNKPSTPESVDDENGFKTTRLDHISSSSVHTSGVSCITGNLVTLQQQQYVPLAHSTTVQSPSVLHANSECVMLPGAIQTADLKGPVSRSADDLCSYSVVLPPVEAYKNDGVSSANPGLDMQCKPLLHYSESVQPPVEYREDTYILKQNFYADGAQGSVPICRTSSISFYPSRPAPVECERVPLYKHESTNTSTHSLYKNESTNTDSIYDFHVASNYGSQSTRYPQKRYEDGTTDTTLDSTYIIETPEISTIFKQNPADQAVFLQRQQHQHYQVPVSDTLRIDRGGQSDSLTPAVSESQIPSDIEDEKVSSSAPPSKSSQEEAAAESNKIIEKSTKKKKKKRNIFSHLRKNAGDASSVTSLASSTTGKTVTSETAPAGRHHQKKTKKESLETKREKKAAKTLAIITGAFVVCWLPFFVIALLMPVCPSCWMSDELFSFFLWLGYFNSTLNPIIYTIFSPEFREAFKRMLCGRKTQRYRPGKYR